MPSGSIGLGPQLDRPFVNGKRVTLEEARAGAGFPIRVPEHPLANAESLTTVWHENEGRHMNHVALEFSSGVEIILEPTPDGVEPFSYLDGVAELGPPAEVVFVHGVPAAVYPANAAWDCEDSESWTEEASVAVDLEGVNYDIYGWFATDDLTAVAKSMPVPDASPMSLPLEVTEELGRIAFSRKCVPMPRGV